MNTLDFQDATFFARKEIIRALKRFRSISGDIISTGEDISSVQVPMHLIENLPELKENPFRRRMCIIFSKNNDGNLTFPDFLDMMSVFSQQVPRDIKVFYAFKIYDFDRDDHIGREDLCTALKLLTCNELTNEEMNQVCDKVMEEGDVDGDGKLSCMEFTHIILRAPDFLSTFHIRI